MTSVSDNGSGNLPVIIGVVVGVCLLVIIAIFVVVVVLLLKNKRFERVYRSSVLISKICMSVRQSVCLSVRPLHSGILWKRLKVSS